MGKYLITSSVSKDKKVVVAGEKGSKLLFGKGESSTSGKDSARILSEGGRRRSSDRREKKSAVVVNSYFKIGKSVSKSALIIPVLLAMTLFGLTIASPTPSLGNQEENALRNQLEDFEDYEFSSEDTSPPKTDGLDSQELDKIRKSIMQDLGLAKIPDPSKANVSQTEYEKAHREYLKRVELSNGQDRRTRRRLHVYYPADPVPDCKNLSGINDHGPKTTPSNSVYFPVEIPLENHAVDHATLRILIDPRNRDDEDALESGKNYEYMVEVSVYQRTKSSRRLMSHQRVSVGRYSPRWAEFDSTEAVASWIHEGEENLGFEMEMKREGSPISWGQKSSSGAALNVFTISATGGSNSSRNRRATPDQLMSLHRGRRTECKGQNKKCCRHEMTVIFKDLKGFEFIIQPKVFDAGYCKGRCPPRYNPAHHHALLQSLIWKEDRKKAPRPCCAPSKLTELEILYFDENDATKLKVSNWKNMKVLECACS